MRNQLQFCLFRHLHVIMSLDLSLVASADQRVLMCARAIFPGGLESACEVPALSSSHCVCVCVCVFPGSPHMECVCVGKMFFWLEKDTSGNWPFHLLVLLSISPLNQNTYLEARSRAISVHPLGWAPNFRLIAELELSLESSVPVPKILLSLKMYKPWEGVWHI